MALDAVADRRSVDGSLQCGGILFRMAAQAEGAWSGAVQLDGGCVLVAADLVAAEAAHRDGRMDRLALGLIFVALQTLRCISVLVEWNLVSLGKCFRSPNAEGDFHERHSRPCV